MFCPNTPLQALVASFGSYPAISAVVGGHEKMAIKWKHPSDRRDGGDIPHSSHIRALLTEARRRNLTLSETDLIWGVDDDRLAQLQAEREAWEARQAALQVAAE